MIRNYKKSTPEINTILTKTIDKKTGVHSRLGSLDVKVRIVLVEAVVADDADDGPPPSALKLHGSPAIAIVKIMDPLGRFLTKCHVLIQIDEYAWAELSEETKIALIDHELTHVDVVRDSNNIAKRNDDRSPKLKMRHGDWQLIGFAEVIERHGGDAHEAKHLMNVCEATNGLQLVFSFKVAGVGGKGKQTGKKAQSG